MITVKRPVKTTKLSSTVIGLFKQHIVNHLKNEEFKSLFWSFFEDNYEQQAFPSGEIRDFRRHFEDILIPLFGNYTIELISWEQYCLSMKSIRTQDWDLSKRKTARKLLSKFYHYIIENVHSDTKGFTELKEHKEFLIWEERSADWMSEDLFEKIGTNFPIESSLDQLHFFSEGQLKIRNNKSSFANILNLNMSKGEVKNLLIGFFLNERRPELALSHFVYLFRYSLMTIEKEPQSITDFTFEVFEKQYRFYKSANKENVANTQKRSENFRFTKYLIRFYSYLCTVIKEQDIQHNIFEGTNYNERNITFYGGKYKSEVVRTVNLLNEVKENLEQHIENHLKDEEFKFIFFNFFEKVYSQQAFTESNRGAVHKYFEQWLISIFENYTIELISWKQYCLSMKSIRVQNFGELGQKMARKLLSQLYRYIIENVHLNTKGLTELREYKEFLLYEERKSSKMNNLLSDYWLDKVGTNFPLESSPNQLHLIPGDDKRFPILFNLNICNDEIKNLLLGFYASEANSKQHNPIRQFIYLFRYSLLAVEKEPQSITDFTFEVLKKQYRFYQKANIINTTKIRNFSVSLIRFYVYLCKIIKEQNIQHNIFEGTLYNENMLSSNSFSLMYDRGYKLISYNSFEDVPLENRWHLIPHDGYASVLKFKPVGIDFTKVKDKSFREDLKYYIWKQSSMSVSTVTRGIYTNFDLLNFISSYKQSSNFTGLVNADSLEQWGFYIGTKEPSTMNQYVKRSRAYLKFYKDKYQIPELLIDLLKQTPIDYDGGTPMTKHDVDLFTKKFQEQRSQGIIGELCYIVFDLATTTKLRSGEILALERDCILEKSDQTGVIQYHSKTSGNQKIKATLTMEKINLIEEAIRLTEDAHSKANTDSAKYIFLKEDTWRKGRIIEIVWQFIHTFSKIQKELEGQLHNKYRPYSLRATYIDNLYTEGINDGLPTAVIAEMAGNGVHTARRYYRKTTEAQKYGEIFAGVTISGVDVYGNILDKKNVEDLNPVEDGLGGCKQEGCVTDEEQYECLICPHFATTTNRIPLFKEQITRLKTLKEITLNSQERNIIDAQLKLYTAYYVKLLEKIGGEQDGAEA
ncbi:tyrosine-type recombinase/integrase [Bacillus sp. FSL W8-0519]|uniref:tyrosine-type recombinase/integrase n=1 Tax=Bacillus sp. FSL W8-0519 TaxID=2954624 RepID=UPI0030F74D76